MAARPQILLWRTAFAVRGQPAGLATSAGARLRLATQACPPSLALLSRASFGAPAVAS